MIRKRSLLAASALLVCLSVSAQVHRMDIDLKKVGAPIQPTMYGIFFEDINYAADGGLYAELVKNRSFEFPNDPLQGWKAFGRPSGQVDRPGQRRLLRHRRERRGDLPILRLGARSGRGRFGTPH